jgi:hypothetical protein
MRSTNSLQVPYTPGSVPDDPKLFRSFLEAELKNISQALLELGNQLPITNIAPAKPREGMLRQADGTHWNPGSGGGVYNYRGGSWRFLG